MRKTLFIINFVFFLLIFCPLLSFADKGHFWWTMNANLTQDSQKAIIIHNKKEEVLILGTELKASKEIGVLEFIPFPSEPVVSLAKGNPFEDVNKLLRLKRIEIEGPITKGGSQSEPVEIRLSQKIGLHDVTVIKINDINGFNNWVIDFLDKKGIKKIELKALKNFSNIAEDYIKRGIQYFVFDYVEVQKTPRFIEPLIYRFKTDKLYYPLKTSNIIGGTGRVEIILILPGTLGIKENELLELLKIFPEKRRPELSSSSKIYLKELVPIYEKVNEFFTDKSKIYLQMLRYIGIYEFKDDLNIDISNIAPYARKIERGWGYKPNFLDNFSIDELNDYFEANPTKKEPKKNHSETEKYKCVEVKTDLVDDKIQYSIKKENQAEFTLKDCLPENLKIQVKNKNIIYKQSIRLVEDGRIEKNDLFAVECSKPFPEDGKLSDYEGINFNFYRAKISPLITERYPLYPTLKLTAQKLNLETPHRTFIIFSGFGGSTYEFFCYADQITYQDKCTYSFDEVLDIHTKDKNTVAIKNLAKKYFKRQNYEKAEKAYRKLVELSDNEGYKGLLSLYVATRQYKKAKDLLVAQLKNSPYETLLYTSLARVYLYEREYDKAEVLIHKALKLRFEKGGYEVYGILGEINIIKKNYRNAITYFEKASRLLKKECEDNKLFLGFFNKDAPSEIDCELQTLPYQLKIIYSLTELEEFNIVEKKAKDLLAKVKNNPYLYGHLSYLYASKGEFNRAIEMADKAISLFKRRGIGANIVMGEIYPVVVSVDRNTLAEKAGLEERDRIINIGDKDLRLFREGNIMQMLIEYINKNEKVKFIIHSENSSELEDVELTPEEILKPEASQALAFKALILRVNGNPDEFEKQALKAYELNPEDSLVQITMALARIDDNKPNEAIEIIEHLDKESNDSLFLLIKPIIYAKAGQMNKAKEFYREIPKELLKTKNALYKSFLNEVNKLLKGG